MKRLLIFLVLSLFLFNWIGYQLYKSISDQDVIQMLSAQTGNQNFPAKDLNSAKKPTVQISLYAKELDFDDLLEFTSTPDYSVNEIFFTLSNDLFSDHANKENEHTTFKCFNGEYYSGSDKLFSKYPDAYGTGIKPDRHLLKIPTVFLSPQEHPPQIIG